MIPLNCVIVFIVFAYGSLVWSLTKLVIQFLVRSRTHSGLIWARHTSGAGKCCVGPNTRTHSTLGQYEMNLGLSRNSHTHPVNGVGQGQTQIKENCKELVTFRLKNWYYICIELLWMNGGDHFNSLWILIHSFLASETYWHQFNDVMLKKLESV